MQIIKYLLLVLIFILSKIIGQHLSNKYIFRLKELEELKNTINILKTKIKFTYEPIPEIFEEISNNSSYNIAQIFKKSKNKMKNKSASISWEEAIDETICNLNLEDKEKLKTLSKLLRHNRCRRTIKSNRNNRKIYRRTNQTSSTRKNKK